MSSPLRTSRTTRTRSPRAFSLIELVIIIVIIGIIAAIAAPRVSSAGRDAQTKAVQATLANVNAAIDHFYAEHSRYPGFNPTNGNPDGDWFVKQLTTYSDANGNVQTSLGGDFLFGPYLQSPFPTNPYNGMSNVHVKAGRTGAVALNSSGWIAVLSDGSFTINTTTDKIKADVLSAKEVDLIKTLRTGS
ncbi:MAG TPA: prepilin-type N-terminal cleavage/methylation domain-containing protein [Phycisphaerae bacterium]|nr:prepilin-type N-terminal cleavage/methylation domain-containing protein [Phycisphaerales bacterium]HRX83816.1 prepilin-type N-terminal cleavage/methylation domain-containing protein [Phycisphaerae bacterium]